MDIFQIIQNYQPYNDQEARDQELILQFMKRNDDAFSRDNLAAHLTVSSYIVDSKMNYIVFGFHHIYQSWSWIGGHADGDQDLFCVALKEAKEETNLQSIRPYNDEIFSLDVIYVPNHIKRNLYVPDHLHLNITYLFIADLDEKPKPNPDEHQDVKWFLIDDVLNIVTEERMKSVYLKAFERLRKLKEEIKP